MVMNARAPPAFALPFALSTFPTIACLSFGRYKNVLAVRDREMLDDGFGPVDPNVDLLLRTSRKIIELAFRKIVLAEQRIVLCSS